MRVLVLHNRYRIEGGEERSVELQLRALRAAGVEHRLLERRSDEAGRAGAATAMLRGGAAGDEVASAVRDLGADVVHVHNMQPLLWQSVARFVAPSRWAAGQLALLGAPSGRLEVLPHYVRDFASASRAHEGSYALVVARLSVEKGIDVAIEASAASGVPLRIAGEGPAGEELAALASRL